MLETSEDLRVAYNSYLRNLEIIQDLAVRDEIKNVFEGEKAEDIIWIKMSIAAAIILLIIGTIIIYILPRDHNEYIALFKPYPDVISMRDQGSRFTEALNHYNNKKTIQAIEGFMVFQNSDTSHFYLAQCYMEIGQFDSAISFLQKIPQESIFREQSKWYLALSILLEGDKLMARQKLKEIRTGQYGYEASQKLLRELE